MNDEIEMEIPSTVGEMVDFLRQFPRDFALDFFYKNGTGEDVAYDMNVLILGRNKELEITIK